MNVYELRDACIDAMDRGDKFIVLVTRSTRLCKTRGPLGVLRCQHKNGDMVVAFRAEKVLKFIDRELKHE